MPQELTPRVRECLAWLSEMPQVRATFHVAGAPFAFVMVGVLEGDLKTLSGWRIYKGWEPDPTEDPSVSGADEDFRADLFLDRCDHIEVDNKGVTVTGAGHSVRIIAWGENADDD